MKMNLGLSKGLLFAGIFSLLTGQSSSWAAGAFLNGEFSTRLFRSVTKGKDLDNSVISPYAISLAMGMAIFGARGRTAQQLGHVQPWTLRPEAFSKLWVANRLWVQREHKLLKSFLEGSDQKFDVRPWMVDFTKAPDFLSDRINGWVEEKTAHHVKDFLNIDSIDTSMKMLLSSVLFFHGDWYTQFDRSSVKEDVFTISPGKTVKLPFMQTTGMFRQKKQGDFQILEIPYFERDLVMDVFLPDAGNDLENLEEYLSNNGIEPVIADLVPTETTVILPKFEIGNTVDLTEAMKTLGVVDAF
jgi:serpin B